MHSCAKPLARAPQHSLCTSWLAPKLSLRIWPCKRSAWPCWASGTGSTTQLVLVTERVEHGYANGEHGHALVRFLRLRRHHCKAYSIKLLKCKIRWKRRDENVTFIIKVNGSVGRVEGRNESEGDERNESERNKSDERDDSFCHPKFFNSRWAWPCLRLSTVMLKFEQFLPPFF